ncbi:MAG TPA: ABC transporter ATP-binding protein [Candidatus Limnocylindrales bacterium]
MSKEAQASVATAAPVSPHAPAAGSAPVVLAARDLRKRYGAIEAVRGVSLEIHEGETYGLLGPNGAGKTTTISMICGLLARDGGEVTLDGTPIDVGAVAAKAGIGFVPQDLAIYPDLSARENLQFFGRLYGLSGARLKTRIGEVLEIVGLTARANDRTDKYSGGMQRRLNIGIGLLHQPRLLLLDEPTVGVDPQSRSAILESIAALGRQGMAILYTTHYMEEAERLCDRVGIIDAGEIRAEGTQRELVALVGEQDTVRLTVTGDVVRAAADVAKVPGVVRADAKDNTIEILVSDARRALPRLIDAAEVRSDVKGVDVVEPDLEAVFLHLTGRALRDAAK